MRPSNPELENQILQVTLKMLLEKESCNIGMRDIASACNVTPPSIYRYYKDKETLFHKVSLYCLDEIRAFMLPYIQKETEPLAQAKSALEGFRDWCFKNPQIALLVLGRIKVEDSMTAEEAAPFYACNNLGEELLKSCVKSGISESPNSKLDTGVIISGLWGCIEATLMKRSDPEFWDKGVEYTDRFIELMLKALFLRG